MVGASRCGSDTVFGIQKCSRGCGDKGWSLSRSSCAIFRVVSEAVQKRGGASHHPICRQVGTTSWIGSVLFSLGRM